MPAKRSIAKKVELKKEAKAEPKTLGKFAVPVYSLAGKVAGSMTLPKEIFGAEVNEKLLAQAIRVYSANQKGHFASTKTRGEVQGSSKKMGSQKGSGHARHGSIRAPIYIGGGIALGPKMRLTRYDLPKKMKQAALISALSAKLVDKEIVGIAGLEKASGKTKEMSKFVRSLDKKSLLILTDNKAEMVVRAAKNLERVLVLPIDQLNAFEVIKYQTLMLTKEAVSKLEAKQK
ncbi:50S ribosomal protein L4 [Candidatus Daviesbacteria bacterium]|nr:50S ribosomal protein L4 [Candidatus Daviesbacteria bacterium]